MQAQKKLNKQVESLHWDEEEDDFPRRSKEEIARIVGENNLIPQKISPWLVVKFQVVLTISFTILSVLGSNPVGWNQLAKSVLAGGIVGILPTAIFALRLSMEKKNETAQAAGFVVALVSGEFIKIVVTVCLVAALAWNVPNLGWLPMLGMYVLTLKCYWLAWLFKRKVS
jgi:ATP synthase protein I